MDDHLALEFTMHRFPAVCPPPIHSAAHFPERPLVCRVQHRVVRGRPAARDLYPSLARLRFATLRLLRGVLPVLACAVFPFVAHAVDVNAANQSQLENVRGIGPKTASTIVRERQQNGAFSSYANLTERVGGIGPKRIERLKKAGLTLGPSSAGHGGSAKRADVIVNTPNPVKGKGN